MLKVCGLASYELSSMLMSIVAGNEDDLRCGGMLSFCNFLF